MASALIAMMGLSGAARAELKVGDAAPDFKLQGSDGKTYSLSDFKGKQPVVLAWFPKAFTGGWTQECNALRASALDKATITVTLLNGAEVEVSTATGSGLDKFDVTYFAASCDTAETNAKYAKALQIDYAILSDPKKDVARAYEVVDDDRAVPRRWTYYIGKDGKILHIDKAVKPASHGKDIAAKLKELGVPEK